MPSSTSPKNQRLTNGMMTPTFIERPVTRLAAAGEAMKPISAAAASTRRRVSAATAPRPLSRA